MRNCRACFEDSSSSTLRSVLLAIDRVLSCSEPVQVKFVIVSSQHQSSQVNEESAVEKKRQTHYVPRSFANELIDVHTSIKSNIYTST